VVGVPREIPVTPRHRRSVVKRWVSLALVPALVIGGCEHNPMESRPNLEPLPPARGTGSLAAGSGASRTNGLIGTPTATPPALISTANSETPLLPLADGVSLGDITLDFADSDIREVVAQTLGNVLHANYTIDPAVRGTATLHSAGPMSRGRLMTTLQSLLAANNATIVETAGLYRVVPAPGAGASLGAGGEAGSAAVPLRYASAPELAKILQPFLQNGGKIAAESGTNALVVVGDPATRAALTGLIKGFDVDSLAGQSYALFPVTAGDAQETATALQAAFRAQSGGALAGVVRVVPMQTINSVLLIAGQPAYIEDARRVFAMIERVRRQTVRSWRVFYLQNSRSNDVANVLQQAFTPGHVTAQPTRNDVGSTAPGAQTSRLGGGGGGGGGGMGGGGRGMGQGGRGGAGGTDGLTGSPNAAGGGSPGQAGANNADDGGAAAGNPLLGGLGGQPDQSDSTAQTSSMRIIPNNQNNAVLIYGTPQEVETAEAMLRKVDILPLQVLIEAVIAEVTLNDDLKYGTQFFFKSRGVNVILDNAAQAVTSLAGAALATQLPGLAIGGSGAGGAPFVIQALQAVTQVNVLSSPQLLVMDNHPARLQVGALVPYLTQSGQSTLVSNAPVINSIDYRETGVITQVTPRVNSGGLVTLDISQEVSNVDQLATQTQGINSPTFFERSVQSRVVVQDGQTVGLAGLIQDSSSRGNQGIPWLKDVPLLGWLSGTQANSRTRTELLVLLTPRVIHDQRDARAATEELRAGLANAAMVPELLRTLKPSGSNDPGAALRRKLKLESP
jgi:general secretion pathway protein D